MPYGVAVIVGEVPFTGLAVLSRAMHVWVPELPAYEREVAEIRSSIPEYSNERGVTTYHFEPGEAPDETVVSLLTAIDMHHGEFKHDPPWQFMKVIGAPITDVIKEAFAEYGADKFETIDDGFVVRRG